MGSCPARGAPWFTAMLSILSKASIESKNLFLDTVWFNEIIIVLLLSGGYSSSEEETESPRIKTQVNLSLIGVGHFSFKLQATLLFLPTKIVC